MTTADSVKAKLQGLIAKANETTGNTDSNLTAAVEALVAGFGQGGGGLPAGIAEYEVQTFTPEADTNAEQFFSLDMEETPTHIYIETDIPEAISRSFIAYYCDFPKESTNIGDGIYMDGRTKNWATNYIQYLGVNADTSTNRSGVWGLTNKGFTFRAPLYGGQHHYFRAGYTYTIIAMRLVTPE